MNEGDVVAMTDQARARRGYLSIAETCDLAAAGNVILDPWSFLLAVDGGRIEMGDGNEFGDGGFVIKVNRSGSQVRVGSDGRYVSGPQVMGRSTLGDGRPR